jgi:TRAP-type mannitol/chloroaromatic compound transport system permease small subunit
MKINGSEIYLTIRTKCKDVINRYVAIVSTAEWLKSQWG